MKLQQLDSAQEVAKAGAEFIFTCAREALDLRDRFILALSGGSTPWLMLHELVGYHLPWNKVHILQSRPMTASKPQAKPDQPWHKNLDRTFTWTKKWGALFRLEQDVTIEKLKHMKDCYDEVGSSMTVNHIGHLANGYMYVRSNPVGERTLKKRHKLQTPN